MSGPYSRVYLSILNDPRFATVYDHDARLATWLRLLLLADAAYPAPVPIPVNVNRRAFRHLVDVAGLVEEHPGRRYAIHGMAQERVERTKWGRDLARIRARKDDQPLNEPVERPRMHRQDETRQDKTSRRGSTRETEQEHDAKTYDERVRARWKAMGLPTGDS